MYDCEHECECDPDYGHDDDNEDCPLNGWEHMDCVEQEKKTLSVETETGIKNRMWKKAFDLQKHLLRHFLKQNELSDVDVIRYTAMVEVLEAMLA